jgi:hypothetical protein
LVGIFIAFAGAKVDKMDGLLEAFSIIIGFILKRI